MRRLLILTMCAVFVFGLCFADLAMSLNYEVRGKAAVQATDPDLVVAGIVAEEETLLGSARGSGSLILNPGEESEVASHGQYLMEQYLEFSDAGPAIRTELSKRKGKNNWEVICTGDPIPCTIELPAGEEWIEPTPSYDDRDSAYVMDIGKGTLFVTIRVNHHWYDTALPTADDMAAYEVLANMIGESIYD